MKQKTFLPFFGGAKPKRLFTRLFRLLKRRLARHGVARQGTARHGTAWPGKARQARPGKARHGRARRGLARRGMARHGRHGRRGRQGNAGNPSGFSSVLLFPVRLHKRQVNAGQVLPNTLEFFKWLLSQQLWQSSPQTFKPLFSK